MLAHRSKKTYTECMLKTYLLCLPRCKCHEQSSVPDVPFLEMDHCLWSISIRSCKMCEDGLYTGVTEPEDPHGP